MKQQYDSYKPSGIDWIGDIPSHWKIQRLKFGMNLINGRAYLQPELLSEGKYRILRVGNFFTNDSWYYSDMELEDNKYCSKGDLLYAWSASIGPYIWNEEKVIFHYHIWKVGLSGKMDKKYSFYLLDVITKVKLNDMHGSAMQHLTMENMNNSDIIVPPLAEQEAIAAWLDEKCGEIDAAIAKVDREIELIDELKQSEISRVVTRGLNPDAPLRPSGIDWIDNIPLNWSSMKLKHTVKDIETDFMDGDWIESSDISTEGIRYLTSGNIGPGYYKEQGEGFISEETFAELNCIEVFSGDLLISRLNEPIARTCFIPDLGYRIVTCVDNVIYRPIENLFDKRYMMYQLNTKPFWFNASQLSSGATMQRISRSKLGAIKVIVPPLTEQQAIADYLDKKCAEIDGLKAKLSKKRETLTELRQSIISEVVTGKRKVI